jgi:hypothetical protein
MAYSKESNRGLYPGDLKPTSASMNGAASPGAMPDGMLGKPLVGKGPPTAARHVMGGDKPAGLSAALQNKLKDQRPHEAARISALQKRK